MADLVPLAHGFGMPRWQQSWGYAYGYVQRRLAARYDVTLIHRQVLARTIAEPGATVDGLHFSNQGHRRMAETVWPIIGNAIATAVPRNPAPG